MRKTIITRSGTLTLFLILGLVIISNSEPHQGVSNWMVGSASVKITPVEKIWMSGFASREEPAKGTMHDLWVKSMVLKDSTGGLAIFITADLIGISREVSVELAGVLMKKYGLPRSRIIIATSHTHSGPVVNKNLEHIYPPFSPEQTVQHKSYLTLLKKRLINVVELAFGNLRPANIYSGEGIARFSVNRRNNPAGEVPVLFDLEGPSDYSVPVLKVTDLKGEIRTLVFGYACHATTLSGLEWSGDYPGFAQIGLEREFTGIDAMFFAGCGADQNPIPRGKASMARQYGKELAAAVVQVVEEPMKELRPIIKSNYSEIELDFAPPLPLDTLKKIASEPPAFYQRWAEYYIREIEEGRPLAKSYPNYPVQIWQLGSQRLVALGGEVVVGYSKRIKEMLGNETFIAGYSNDVMAYIPTVKILREGGYEGNTSMRVYGHPSIFAESIEEKILRSVEELYEILR